MDYPTTLEQTVLMNFGTPEMGEAYSKTHQWTVEVSERRNSTDIHPFLNSVGDRVKIYVWKDINRVYMGLIVDDVKQSLGDIPIENFNHKVVGAIVSAYVTGVIEMKKKIRKIVN